MKDFISLNDDTKLRRIIIGIIAFICGWFIGLGIAHASSEGGQIIDKVYQPSRTYLVEYHGDETEVNSDPSYEFIIMYTKEETDRLIVDKKTYLSYNIGDEYYRCEDD